MKPRAHAELIKQWADGAQIEYMETDEEWHLVDSPRWTDTTSYRVKPKIINIELQLPSVSRVETDHVVCIQLFDGGNVPDISTVINLHTAADAEQLFKSLVKPFKPFKS